MKKLLKIGVILVTIFMITGCVKMEVSMGINKDKSMDLEIIEAFDKSLMEGNESDFDTSSFKDAENQGFLVREYSDGDMQGYTLTRKFENIDNLSTEENDYVSDFSLILEKSDVSLFSIKKGFLKNTYTAKLKFSNSSMGNDFSTDDAFTSEDDWSSSDSDFSSDMDYTQMMSNMDMNFVVKLPYKVVNSNATSIDNNGKQLTWNLMTHQAETIDFEFELYNMTNVYIVVGIALVVIVLVVVVIVNKVGNSKSSGNKTMMSNNVDRQNTYTSILNNTNYNNTFINSNDSFSNIENSNSFISPSVNPVSTPDNTSNNMFFNSQDLAVNTTEQTINETPSIQTPSIPLSQLDQFNVDNSEINNISVSNESILSNDNNSILTDLETVNLNATPINNIPTQPVIPEPVVQPQSVIPNQNVEVSNNKFFQDPNDL